MAPSVVQATVSRCANSPSRLRVFGNVRRCDLGRAYGFYRRYHVDRVVAMTLKAAGLNPQGKLARPAAAVGYWLIKTRGRRALAAEP